MTDRVDDIPLWPSKPKVKAEVDVESECCKWATKNGWLTYKFTSPSRRAVPDRVFIGYGVVLWIELKRKGKEPTPLQYKRGRDIEKHTGRWAWFDDVEKFKEYLEGFML